MLGIAAGAAAQSESQKLNARVAELYRQGDLDAAIPLAEQIVNLERGTNQSKRNLANALENLGQLKLDRIKRLMAELGDPAISKEKANAAAAALKKDAVESDTYFREGIAIADTLADNFEQAINLRTKLAWLIYNYRPPDSSPSLGFDRDTRDKLELWLREVYVGRSAEAKRLYTSAQDIAQKSGNETLMLRSNFNLAEFESFLSNFEAAVPLYEKLIADAERILPRRSPDLVPPYEAYLKLLVATGQEEKAFDVLSKMVAATGRSASYPKTLLNLTRRFEGAYKPVNSLSVEADAKRIKAERELAGRSVVARVAAAGGNAPQAALATSVDGRVYYETLAAKGIRMIPVVVLVEVDEAGKAVKAEANSGDRSLNETAEAAIRARSFRPLLIGGKPSRMTGFAEVFVLSN